MTSMPTIADEAESFVQTWLTELTRVRDSECLCCYVARLLDDSPCDGSLRHALRYRDERVPRATALKRRLGDIGGFCDCEIFLNAYQLLGADEVRDVDEEEADEEAVLYAKDVLNEDDEREEWPPCQGVRRGSAKPCGNWVRIRRW